MASFETPTDLWYTKEGLYVRIEGNIATIGISDWLQDNLGDLICIQYTNFGNVSFTTQTGSNGDREFPPLSFGHDLDNNYFDNIWNNEVLEAPFGINNQPYDSDNWLIKLELNSPEDRTGLLTAQEFAKLKGFTPYTN